MISTHLRKKDDPNKDYLYAYTEMLATQPDMIPCDKHGNPVGVAGEITDGGMRPREPEAPSLELTIALDAIASLKAEIEALKDKGDPVVYPVDKVASEPTVEEAAAAISLNVDKQPKEVTPDEMSRNTLFDYLQAKYGEKAEHLKGNMSKITLLDEAEKLQAAADLDSIHGGDTEA